MINDPLIPWIGSATAQKSATRSGIKSGSIFNLLGSFEVDFGLTFCPNDFSPFRVQVKILLCLYCIILDTIFGLFRPLFKYIYDFIVKCTTSNINLNMSAKRKMKSRAKSDLNFLSA